jgi:ribonuclease Z
VLRDVRQSCDGPLALATDYMVFNVTKDDIHVRMAAIDEDIRPKPAASGKKLPPDPSQRIGFTEFIMEGRVVFADVLKALYDRVNEAYGSNEEPPL